MSAAPIIISGVHCRFCDAIISQATLAEAARYLISHQFGDNERGYTCWKCQTDEAERIAKLPDYFSSLAIDYEERPDAASPPCLICGTREGDLRSGPFFVDGAEGFICMPCSTPLNIVRVAMREIRHTKMEYDLKLK